MPRTRSLMAAAVVAAVTLLAGTTTPAWAHTSLIGSEPADGARVDALPDVVSLAFSDKIQEPAYVVVTAPDGTELQRGDAVVEGSYVRQEVDAGPATGEHTITYRVVSADGHPVQGQITAQVGPEPDESSEPDPATSATDDGADQGLRESYRPLTIGLLVALGLLLVGRIIVKRRQR